MPRCLRVGLNLYVRPYVGTSTLLLLLLTTAVNKLFVYELFPLMACLTSWVGNAASCGRWRGKEKLEESAYDDEDGGGGGGGGSSGSCFPGWSLGRCIRGPRSIEVHFRPLTKAHQASCAIDTEPVGRSVSRSARSQPFVGWFGRSSAGTAVRLAWITTLKSRISELVCSAKVFVALWVVTSVQTARVIPAWRCAARWYRTDLG